MAGRRHGKPRERVDGGIPAWRARWRRYELRHIRTEDRHRDGRWVAPRRRSPSPSTSLPPRIRCFEEPVVVEFPGVIRTRDIAEVEPATTGRAEDLTLVCRLGVASVSRHRRGRSDPTHESGSRGRRSLGAFPRSRKEASEVDVDGPSAARDTSEVDVDVISTANPTLGLDVERLDAEPIDLGGVRRASFNDGSNPSVVSRRNRDRFR